ncbi:phosphoketolase family protein [Nonomuraea sp. NPDC004702]
MWGELAARAHHRADDKAVTDVFAALNYLCAAQLYLADNVGLRRPLTPADVKDRPRGHWGICPPVNAMLAALGPLRRALADEPDAQGLEVHIVHGGGHAAPSALAYAYLTGELGRADPAFARSPAGLHHLVTGFPHPAFGGEITPLIPGHPHTGGQLGPALAIAQGAVLDAPHRLAIALIGDGECETGATAAAWLGARALRGTGGHGTVLPVVLLNGQRMGGPSLLAGLSPDELRGYFTGLGYEPIVCDGHDLGQLRQHLAAALEVVPALGADTGGVVLVLTMPKGHTGPDRIGDRRLNMHKTPLSRPRTDPAEFTALKDWLTGYQPHRLLTGDGQPAPGLAPALPGPTQAPADAGALTAPRGCIAASCSVAETTEHAPFAVALPHLLRQRAAAGSFRLFSPDELASNRLPLADARRGLPSWAVEVLNEELCHAWAQGYTETGRHALIVGYEAFAPITASLIVQQLKHRAARRHAGLPELPSLVYLLTSLGWHNTFTHQNPGLISAMIAAADPTLRLYTPADTARTAATLTFALRKLGRASIITASKHPLTPHPLTTLDDELRHGAAIWPHLSDAGRPDLVLASAGDVPAHQLSALAARLRRRSGLRLRYVHIHDLTALGDPGLWPHALSDDALNELFTTHAPILLATTGHAADIHALLGPRHPGARLRVLGYHDPGRPVSTEQLLASCGLDLDGLTRHALEAARAHRPTPARLPQPGRPTSEPTSERTAHA